MRIFISSFVSVLIGVLIYIPLLYFFGALGVAGCHGFGLWSRRFRLFDLPVSQCACYRYNSRHCGRNIFL